MLAILTTNIIMINLSYGFLNCCAEKSNKKFTGKPVNFLYLVCNYICWDAIQERKLNSCASCFHPNIRLFSITYREL